MDSSRDKYTITQAARRLGLTDDGVRKRIKRGQLGAYRVDGRTYVVLDGETDQHDSLNGHKTARQDRPDSRPDDRHDKTDSSLVPLVARLEDEVRWLRSELERKDAIIMRLVEQWPALPAPRDAPTDLSGGPTEADSRPWWAALLWWRR